MKKQQGLILFILGVIFLSLTLRAPITAVGPVLPLIQKDLHLSNGLAGFLTTIPLLAFAVISPFAAPVAKRLGTERTLFYSLLLLAGGIILRTAGGISVLLVGTAFIGIAIAFGNVLLPSISKHRFPAYIGLLTSVFTVMMNLSAGLSAGLSYPVANWGEWSWKGSLVVWILLTAIAIVAWLPQLRYKEAAVQLGAPRSTKAKSILTSPVTWAVTLMMAFQSLIFYTTATWIPAMLIEKGLEADKAGWMLSIMQFSQLPFTFLTPIVAAKMKNQKPIIWLFSILYFIGFGGLLLDGQGTLSLLWMVLLGGAGGAGFSLAMMLFSLRTRTAVEAAELSGIAQSIGYLLAAVGPVLFGIVQEMTGSWHVPTILFLVTAFVLFLSGYYAAGDRYVREK